jgi:hypothetical protein
MPSILGQTKKKELGWTNGKGCAADERSIQWKQM